MYKYCYIQKHVNRSKSIVFMQKHIRMYWFIIKLTYHYDYLALHRLRNTTEVSAEIDEMSREARETKSDEAISLKELFTAKDLRWPLLTGLVLQLTQQLCGINAVSHSFSQMQHSFRFSSS